MLELKAISYSFDGKNEEGLLAVVRHSTIFGYIFVPKSDSKKKYSFHTGAKRFEMKIGISVPDSYGLHKPSMVFS